jgi:outer membrane protein assembly factor BamB
MDVLHRTAQAAAVVGTVLVLGSATVAAAGAMSPQRTAAAASSPWNETDYNAALSRANVTEQTLTPSTLAKIQYLRSVAAPPNSPNSGCSRSAQPGVVAPVLTGGSLYAVAGGFVVRYDAATGNVTWRQNPDPLFGTAYTSLGVARGLVVVGEYDCTSASGPEGKIQAFNASTGALVWSQPTTPVGGMLNQLVISSGDVVAAGTSPADGQVVSVHKLTTGALVWYRTQGNQCDFGNVMVDAQVVIDYSCSAANPPVASLVGSNLATGARIWSLSGTWQFQRGDTGTPAGRHVFATSPGGSVVSLDPLTGHTQYTLTGASTVFAVDASQAYASCGTHICAYDSATGSLRWQTQPSIITALGAEAGGVLYADDGFALNAATGQTIVENLWLGTATSLVIGDGRIAVVTDPRIIDLYGLPGY